MYFFNLFPIRIRNPDPQHWKRIYNESWDLANTGKTVDFGKKHNSWWHCSLFYLLLTSILLYLWIVTDKGVTRCYIQLILVYYNIYLQQCSYIMLIKFMYIYYVIKNILCLRRYLDLFTKDEGGPDKGETSVALNIAALEVPHTAHRAASVLRPLSKFLYWTISSQPYTW